MNDEKELKEMAKLFREAADTIDEIIENTDKEREDELFAKFMVKMIRLEELK